MKFALDWLPNLFKEIFDNSIGFDTFYSIFFFLIMLILWILIAGAFLEVLCSVMNKFLKSEYRLKHLGELEISIRNVPYKERSSHSFKSFLKSMSRLLRGVVKLQGIILLVCLSLSYLFIAFLKA
jgi:hypothetical protein